jgi:hypothetical protein
MIGVYVSLPPTGDSGGQGPDLALWLLHPARSCQTVGIYCLLTALSLPDPRPPSGPILNGILSGRPRIKALSWAKPCAAQTAALETGVNVEARC